MQSKAGVPYRAVSQRRRVASSSAAGLDWLARIGLACVGGNPPNPYPQAASPRVRCVKQESIFRTSPFNLALLLSLSLFSFWLGECGKLLLIGYRPRLEFLFF